MHRRESSETKKIPAFGGFMEDKKKHNSKHRDRPRDGGIVFDGMR